ncbi:MAG: hypothetical protein ACI9BW_000311 [Gammaproteobacteria bacterium]|jgi:hypothetical protein
MKDQHKRSFKFSDNSVRVALQRGVFYERLTRRQAETIKPLSILRPYWES